MTHEAAGRESEITKKHKSEKKTLSPQLHAADIAQDSRRHMDKKAKIS
jgi:hypothetical protein